MGAAREGSIIAVIILVSISSNGKKGNRYAISLGIRPWADEDVVAFDGVEEGLSFRCSADFRWMIV